MFNSYGNGEMLKPRFQQTVSFRVYEAFKSLNKDNRLQPVAVFMLMFMAMEMLKGVGFAASGIQGIDFTSGSIKEADLDGDTSTLMTNIRRGISLVQVIGSVIAGAGIVFTFLQYRNEEQPQRAQQLAVRGFVSLFIINIVITIINFSLGAFESGY